jgi:hypothetical protein
VPEDFTNNWPVQFGSFIERFALDWHERKTAIPLTRRGEVVQHPTRPDFCCTLDAWREFDRRAIDCKATNAWTPPDDVLAFYMPQMIGQRACTGADSVAILLVHGGGEPVEYEMEIDAAFEALVWQRVDQFAHCVETLTPPVTLQLKRIVPPDKWQRIDLDTDSESFNWASDMILALRQWAENEGAAELFDDAKLVVKKLLPDHCGRLTHAGVVVARSKNNAVTIRRAKTL